MSWKGQSLKVNIGYLLMSCSSTYLIDMGSSQKSSSGTCAISCGCVDLSLFAKMCHCVLPVG
jgi:hypothetical protein